MLKSENGSVIISGNILTIAAEMTGLIHNIYEDVLQKGAGMSESDARRMIMDIVKTALKPIEEVRRENAENMQRAEKAGTAGKILNLLDALRKSI